MTNGELIDLLLKFPIDKIVEVNTGTFFYSEYGDITEYPQIESVSTSTREPEKIFLEGVM